MSGFFSFQLLFLLLGCLRISFFVTVGQAFCHLVTVSLSGSLQFSVFVGVGLSSCVDRSFYSMSQEHRRVKNVNILITVCVRNLVWLWEIWV